MKFFIGSIKKSGFISYLGASESFGGRRRSVASILILTAWLAVVGYVSVYHELWRPEARSLTLALEPTWFWELPMALSNEGHPLLWYLLVRLAYWIVSSPQTLQVLSISVAFAGVIIFFRYAPFPVWQKILFISGMLPLYEYAVKCRHYGISMLLFFLFAALYKHRKERPILLACVLAALANTNVNSCILTGFLAAIWFIDDVVIEWHMLDRRRISGYGYAFGLVGIGILCSVAIAMPTKEGIVLDTPALQIGPIMSAFLLQLKYPARLFSDLFPGWLNQFRNELVWLLVLGLLIRVHLAIILYLAIAVIGTLFFSIHPGDLRHQGIIFLFIITLYWLVYKQTPILVEDRFKFFLSNLHKGLIYFILPIISMGHISASLDMVRVDLSKEMSSSKAFGEFIEARPEYHDAILMGDPDHFLDSMAYYTSNQIYIPRERRFGNRVWVTTVNQPTLSLQELLEIGQQVKKDEGKPVLIVLGHLNLADMSTTIIRYRYKRIFSWSPEELRFFEENTEHIATFDQAVTDENYEVYLVL